jgi:hypothetical protein
MIIILHCKRHAAQLFSDPLFRFVDLDRYQKIELKVYGIEFEEKKELEIHEVEISDRNNKY